MGAIIRSWAVLFAVLAGTIVSDQTAKRIVQNLHATGIELSPPLAVSSWNHGINFGLFADASTASALVLAGLSLVICGFFLVLAHLSISRHRADVVLLVGVGAFVGGGLSNAIDRLVFGAVFDFINLSVGPVHVPYVFNPADIAIVVGVLLAIAPAKSRIWSDEHDARDESR